MSTVILDTITGKSTATTITIGSTPVVSASANSMTIRGEGTAQTSIQQGLCKTWINFKPGGTISIYDSFNVSSLTDTATGQYGININNDFSNTVYAVSGIQQWDESDDSNEGQWVNISKRGSAQTAGALQISITNEKATVNDCHKGCFIFMGDLA
jgi:hypothetical protein